MICTKHSVGWRIMQWRRINRWRRCPCSIWCQCIAGVSAEWCRPGSWRVWPSQVIPCEIKNWIIFILKFKCKNKFNFPFSKKLFPFVWKSHILKRTRIILFSQLSSKRKEYIPVSQNGMGKGSPSGIRGWHADHPDTYIFPRILLF